MTDHREDSECVARKSTDPFVIEFISAADIPCFDGKTKSDPFLRAYISSYVERRDNLGRKVSPLERISNLVQTPRRLECTSVLWHCYRDFNVKPSSEALLTVELHHHNMETLSGVPLGKMDISLSKLVDEEPVTFPLFATKEFSFGRNPNFLVTLRRVFTKATAPLYRTFFLIRHGESKWNEAQAKISITGMLDKDHPLTSDGINQACALNARWRLAKSQGKAKYASSANLRSSMCSELIDFTRLGEADLIAMEGGDDDEGSDGGSEDEGASKGGLGKLYDAFFQRHSTVTAAGKPRTAPAPAPVSAPAPAPARARPKISKRASYVPSFLDSEILDFTADSPPPPPTPPPASAPLIDLYDSDPVGIAIPATRPTLPAVADPFDLLDGYTPDTRLQTHTSSSEAAAGAAASSVSEAGGLPAQREDVVDTAEDGGDDLPQRREEYIRLFMQVDKVYSSPLTRAVQTALAAMCSHPALQENRLTLYSIIREIKRMGGLDTVGVECGAGIMRRVKAELQLAMGVARAHEISDNVMVDVNDTETPWWTVASESETEKKISDRVREFITYSRYCAYNMPVFVGHSLFFKEFCSKRISTVMSRKRPHLSSNLKRFRLSNASLLAVTVKYTDLDNGCSEAVIVDADLLFGGGFHGVKLAHQRGTDVGKYGAEERDGQDIDGAMQLPSATQTPSVGSRLQHTVTHKVSSGGRALGRRVSTFASSITDFFDK